MKVDLWSFGVLRVLLGRQGVRKYSGEASGASLPRRVIFKGRSRSLGLDLINYVHLVDRLIVPQPCPHGWEGIVQVNMCFAAFPGCMTFFARCAACGPAALECESLFPIVSNCGAKVVP